MDYSNVRVESTRYCGFASYGKAQVSTLKPGVENLYQKDIYKDISNYNSRKIPYFEDKNRYETMYMQEHIKKVNEENFKNLKSNAEIKEDLNCYQYSHEPEAIDILKLDNLKRNEDAIRTQ